MYDPGGGPPNMVPQQPDNFNFIFNEDENNQPLWFVIKDIEGQNEISNMKYRDVMITVNKLLPNVSQCKLLSKEKVILFRSLKKHRDELCSKKQLGNIRCVINERQNLNTVKGTINHPSIAETNEEELLEDLRNDNKNIASVFIFKKFSSERNEKVNTTSAVVTFDTITLPPQVTYLKYTILKTRLFYPNPMRCHKCFKYGHLNMRDRPCAQQPICGKCGGIYHLNNPTEKCTNSTNCSNCNGPHEAWSTKCPVFQTEKAKTEIMTDRRCSYKEAEKIYENRDNRDNRNKTYSNISAASNTPPTPPNDTDSEEIKILQKQVAAMTTKLDIVCNLLSKLLNSQRERQNSQPTEPAMEVVSDTDSVDEDDQIDPTPNQPTVSDAKNYYTVDYSKKGNNNPPPQFNRHQKKQTEKRHAQEKPKEKENKKKKDKHSGY